MIHVIRPEEARKEISPSEIKDETPFIVCFHEKTNSLYILIRDRLKYRWIKMFTGEEFEMPRIEHDTHNSYDCIKDSIDSLRDQYPNSDTEVIILENFEEYTYYIDRIYLKQP